MVNSTWLQLERAAPGASVQSIPYSDIFFLDAKIRFANVLKTENLNFQITLNFKFFTYSVYNLNNI